MNEDAAIRRMTSAVFGASLLATLLAACGGGGGSAGNTAVPVIPTATPAPGVAIPVISASPLPRVSATPSGTVPQPSTTPGGIGARSFSFHIYIPTTGIARSTSADARRTEALARPTFISSATQAIGITVGSDPEQIIAVGATSPSCATGGALRDCTVAVSLPAAGSPQIRMALYATPAGTDTPISATVISAPATNAVPSTIAFKPVIASLQASVSTQFAAGDPSSTSITVIARTASSDTLNLATDLPVDEDGNPVTIALSNSDTSGKTALAATGYTGAPVAYTYNGDLPLPVLTVGVNATAAGKTLAATAIRMTAPTASHAFAFTLGSASATANYGGLSALDFSYTPDGRFNSVKINDSTYLFNWGVAQASTGSGPLPENQSANKRTIFTPSQIWEQSGAWLLTVYQQNTPYSNLDGQNLIALYHAESYYTGYYDKTMAVTYSHDSGQTWTTGAQIITPPGYPGVAASQHAGDGCVIWDPVKSRWVAFYAGDSITQAESYDKNAAPGTWRKYYQGSYTQPGLGGAETPNPVFTSRYFSSPSVSWNSYLNEWVMTMDGHRGIWLSTSEDLDTWTAPRLVTDGNDLGTTDDVAYSTMIGTAGDKVTQRTSRLYYGRFIPNASRKLYGRTITFTRSD